MSNIDLNKDTEYTDKDTEYTDKDTTCTEEYENSTYDSMLLYILTDRLTSNLLNYFRSSGVMVSHIYTNIQSIRDDLLMQTDPCRIVIIDSGLGKFTSVQARKDIIDMLGLSDEDNKIAVFYTDSIIKSETRDSIEVDYKSINWYKYISTADTVARLLMLKENYRITKNAQKTIEYDRDEILNKKALTMNCKESKYGIGKPIFSVDDISSNMKSTDYNEIKSFKPKY